MLSQDKFAKDQLTERAEELFEQGYNCCESLIRSCVEVFELTLPEDVYLLGKFFRQGVNDSGCICGALAGGIMMLGYIVGKNGGEADVADKFRIGFIEKYGSSCCRVIRKKQHLTGRLRNKECRAITVFTAGTVCDVLGYR